MAISNQPKTYRASMIELESSLKENLDMIDLDSLADIYFTFVNTESKYDYL